MKKTVLSFLTLLALSAGVNAQNVTIPDANFKAYLVGNTAINTNGDNEIQVSEASAFTGTIDCNYLSISDLTGIEAFTSLTELNCSSNLLSSLDVSQNTALEILYCSGNLLNSLDVSQNTALETIDVTENPLNNLDVSQNLALKVLYCYDVSISSLDVSQNISLESLSCGSNNLTSLDVSNNVNLQSLQCQFNSINSLDVSNNTDLNTLLCQSNSLINLNAANGNNTNFTFFYADYNPNLTCIQVDDATYSTTNWTNIDAQTSFSTNCGGMVCSVNIPDANFKAYLLGNTAINTNGNSAIECTEATAFSGTINCPNLSISDLTGIEAFTALTQLTCSNNSISNLDLSNNNALTNLVSRYTNLTSLDVTTNTALNTLDCSYNYNLASLDVSNNTALTSLFCNGNSLISLDVSTNTALTLLGISDNNLSSLDVSTNTALTGLGCNGNSLISLDVSSNIALNLLECETNSLTSLNVANGNNSNFTYLLATNNPNLTCIQVDDVAYSTTNWTDIDATASFSTNCSGAILVSSISVQGQNGASTITTPAGTLQMEATVLPANADDATYTWSVTNGTGSATIAANGLLTAVTDGTVEVTATANDASGETGEVVITISNQTTGIDEEALNNLNIYPNPVQNELFIELTEGQITEINILDLSGKTIKSMTNSADSIDVSDLSQGVYILKVATEKGVSTKRFIKK